VAADGRRKSIRLGKISQRGAETIRIHVEHLVAATISGGAPCDTTSRWVAELDDTLAGKLAKVGLVAERSSATLAAFITQYVESRHDTKPNTVSLYHQVERNLVDFFGATKPLRDITPGNADQWRLYLVGIGLADNTVRRRCGRAKQFFKTAVRLGLISSNPFADLKSSVRANMERSYFIFRDEADKVIEACPDAQWRLLFTLSRYGGLRCPSEHLALRWEYVDWEHGRITVRSPKTEHHAGGESRIIPIFPELRPHLEAVWEQAEPGTEYVITRYRDANANLRTQFQRIIRRAGLKPWPKLFQNLRATRETELAEQFPMHVVCEWIGNSQPVAMKHYLQVTDEHYASALQNPVQHVHELSGMGVQASEPAHEKTPVLQGFASPCHLVHKRSAPPVGLEPTT